MSWDYVTLDMLGDVSRGKSKHRPRNDASLFGGQYPFIQTADVKSADFYINDYTETYNEKGLAQSKLWKSGTLCITIAANIADTAILGIDACFPDSIMGFVPYDGVSDVRFVKYSFDLLQKNMKQISQGTAQDNLSWEKLSTFKFPAPHIDIQRKIADYLSAYDDLIENNQKQIKLLEEAAQRLYKEWFVDLRFPGHEQTRIVDGVPVGWKFKKISDVCLLISAGGTPLRSNKNFWKPDKIKWYKTGELKDCWLILMAIYASPTIGRLGILESEATCNQATLCLIADEAIISWQWLYMKLFELRNDFNAVAKGAGQQNISAEIVKNKEILLPSINVVRQYTEKAENVLGKLRLLQKEIEFLTEARDRLLPKLMNGEIEL